MNDNYNLNRFVIAQKSIYDIALEELKAGYKRSHWMWYIFPQLKHLGRSYNSEYYGISGVDEATAYLQHPTLNQRIREASETILNLPVDDSTKIFGGIDSRKLRSSMTLFDIVSHDDVFARVLTKFFQGKPDARTLRIIQQADQA